MAGGRPAITRSGVGGRLTPNQGAERAGKQTGMQATRTGYDNISAQFAEEAATNSEASGVTSVLPSLYLQNINTPQGPVQVQFAPKQTATFSGLAPVGITRNVSFTQPVNQSSNGFTTTGTATYNYQLAGNQLVPTLASSNGVISYNGTPIANLTPQGAQVIPGATVAEPITGSVGGTNQVIGTLNFNPTVNGSNVGLAYANFTPATVQVAGKTVVNVNGASYPVGFNYPETSSFNPTTNTISFAPTALFSGNQPLPAVNLFQNPQTTNIGSQGVQVASNVLVSPFTQPQSVVLGLIGPGVAAPQQSITYLSGNAGLGQTSVYSLNNGSVSLAQTYTSGVPASPGPTFSILPSAPSANPPFALGQGPQASLATSFNLPTSIFGSSTPVSSQTSTSLSFGSIGLGIGAQLPQSPQFNAFNGVIPTASFTGSSPLTNIVENIGIGGRNLIASYENQLLQITPPTNLTGPGAALIPAGVTIGKGVVLAGLSIVGLFFGSSAPSISPSSFTPATSSDVNTFAFTIAGAGGLSVLGLEGGSIGQVLGLGGLSILQNPRGTITEAIKNPLLTVGEILGGAAIFTGATEVAETVGTPLDVATFGEPPARALPAGSYITDIVVRANPVSTGQTGTIEVLNPTPTITGYETLINFGAVPTHTAEIALGQEAGATVISGIGYDILFQPGRVSYAINAGTEDIGLAYTGAAQTVGDLLQPSSAFSSLFRTALPTTTFQVNYNTVEYSGALTAVTPTIPPYRGIFSIYDALSNTGQDTNVYRTVEFQGTAPSQSNDQFGIGLQSGITGQATVTSFEGSIARSVTTPYSTPPQFIFETYNPDLSISLNTGTVVAFGDDQFRIEPIETVVRNTLSKEGVLKSNYYIATEGSPFNFNDNEGIISRVLSKVSSNENNVQVFRGEQLTGGTDSITRTPFELQIGQGAPNLGLNIQKIEFEPIGNGQRILLADVTDNGVEVKNYLQAPGSKTLSEAISEANEFQLQNQRATYLKATPFERDFFGLEYPERVVPKSIYELNSQDLKNIQNTISTKGLGNTEANIVKGQPANPQFTPQETSEIITVLKEVFGNPAEIPKIESFPIRALSNIQPTINTEEPFNLGQAIERNENAALFANSKEPLSNSEIGLVNKLYNQNPTRALYGETGKGELVIDTSQTTLTNEQAAALRANFAVPTVEQLRIGAATEAPGLLTRTGFGLSSFASTTRVSINNPIGNVIGNTNRTNFANNIGLRNNIATRTNIGTRSNTGIKTNIGTRTNIGIRNNIGTRTNIGTRSNIGFKTNLGLKVNQTQTQPTRSQQTVPNPTTPPPNFPGFEGGNITIIPGFGKSIFTEKKGKQISTPIKLPKLGYTPDLSHILQRQKAPNARIRRLQGLFGVSRGL